MIHLVPMLLSVMLVITPEWLVLDTEKSKKKKPRRNKLHFHNNNYHNSFAVIFDYHSNNSNTPSLGCVPRIVFNFINWFLFLYILLWVKAKEKKNKKKKRLGSQKKKPTKWNKN